MSRFSETPIERLLGAFVAVVREKGGLETRTKKAQRRRSRHAYTRCKENASSGFRLFLSRSSVRRGTVRTDLLRFFSLSLCRPFVRKLPEFKFWVKSAKSLIVAFSMTFFPVFDVPVFWPILLMYFIMLFTMTMKQQLRHMIKHKYVPFSWGKQTYGKGGGGGKEKSGGSD